MRAPNGASTFANRSPIELMSDGEIESLWLVRQYLQAQLV
jgi:hypothetical protein